jgi:hypothetical protein
MAAGVGRFAKAGSRFVAIPDVFRERFLVEGDSAMTNEKQPETEAKLPISAPKLENEVNNQPDDEKELNDEELAGTVGGMQNAFLKFSLDD